MLHSGSISRCAFTVFGVFPVRDSVPGGTRLCGRQRCCEHRRRPNQTAGLPPMSDYHQITTSSRCSVVGTFSELKITAGRDHVAVDIQSRNYDTAGWLHCDHALAKLPLETARRVRALLDAAIAASAGMAPGSPGVWSNATTRVALTRPTRRRRAARRWPPEQGGQERRTPVRAEAVDCRS